MLVENKSLRTAAIKTLFKSKKTKQKKTLDLKLYIHNPLGSSNKCRGVKKQLGQHFLPIIFVDGKFIISSVFISC